MKYAVLVLLTAVLVFPGCEERNESLIEKLSTQDREVYEEASQELIGRGTKALPALLDVIEENQAAAYILQKIGYDSLVFLEAEFNKAENENRKKVLAYWYLRTSQYAALDTDVIITEVTDVTESEDTFYESMMYWRNTMRDIELQEYQVIRAVMALVEEYKYDIERIKEKLNAETAAPALEAELEKKQELLAFSSSILEGIKMAITSRDLDALFASMGRLSENPETRKRTRSATKTAAHAFSLIPSLSTLREEVESAYADLPEKLKQKPINAYLYKSLKEGDYLQIREFE